MLVLRVEPRQRAKGQRQEDSSAASLESGNTLASRFYLSKSRALGARI